MQITEGGHWMKLVGAMAVVGALVAFGISFRVAPNYVSSATVSVTPQVDPVRRESLEVLHQRATSNVGLMESRILSRWSLARIITDPRMDLYKEERRRMPPGDVIEKMRHNIHIEPISSTGGNLAPIVFRISFSYPDAAKAQATVRELVSKFNQESDSVSRVRTQYYEDFWNDMVQGAHAKPAPPPPVGETFGVISDARLPVELAPNRALFLAWGLGGGLLAGLLAVFALRQPRGVWRLCGWALAGGVVACGVSFLIPNRFTSIATMELTPARLTENPTAPVPAVTPAAEYLRQIEPEVLSDHNLSKIIQDPRLNLYPEERAKMPINDVVRKMTGDLSIMPADSTFATGQTVSAFRISFTYSDRFKAQQAVNWLMNSFEEQRQEETMVRGQKVSEVMRQIYQRKGAEVLEVLDPASLPVAPVSPNRALITEGGLFLGLLIGMIRLRGAPRTGSPVLQPA